MLRFNDKVELAVKKLNIPEDVEIVKALITLDKREEIVEKCKELGIVLG